MKVNPITPDTKIALRASQFWGLMTGFAVVIGGATMWMTTQTTELRALRRDHDREVQDRSAADNMLAETLKEQAAIMRDITRELDRK